MEATEENTAAASKDFETEMKALHGKIRAARLASGGGAKIGDKKIRRTVKSGDRPKRLPPVITIDVARQCCPPGAMLAGSAEKNSFRSWWDGELEYFGERSRSYSLYGRELALRNILKVVWDQYTSGSGGKCDVKGIC